MTPRQKRQLELIAEGDCLTRSDREAVKSALAEIEQLREQVDRIANAVDEFYDGTKSEAD